MQLAPEVSRVPLIIRSAHPEVGSNRYMGVTRSIDVYPTLIGLSGFSLEAEPLSGVDLSLAMRGREPPPTLLAFSHSSVLVRSVHNSMYSPEYAHEWRLLSQTFPDQDAKWIWVVIRQGDMRYKLRNLGADTWSVQAFDLASDPSETRDVFNAADPAHADMGARAEQYKRQLERSYL